MKTRGATLRIETFGAEVRIEANAHVATIGLDDRRARPPGPTRMALSKPTSAAITGYAVAGGLEPALLCDARGGRRRGARRVLPARFCRRVGTAHFAAGAGRHGDPPEV